MNSSPTTRIVSASAGGACQSYASAQPVTPSSVVIFTKIQPWRPMPPRSPARRGPNPASQTSGSIEVMRMTRIVVVRS
jgi:hypothetical protein